MTPELIAILGVGITLAGLVWQGLRRIDGRIDRVENRIDRVETALGERIDRVEGALQEIRDRLSRLEGKMDFLEGYIVRRNDPGSAAE